MESVGASSPCKMKFAIPSEASERLIDDEAWLKSLDPVPLVRDDVEPDDEACVPLVNVELDVCRHAISPRQCTISPRR